MALRDRFEDLRARIPGESPLIVDGGANAGTMTRRFLRLFETPRIHAFEPIPELADKLRQAFASRPNVTVHGQALGARNATISFHVVNNLVSSSCFTPTPFANRLHGERMAVRETIQVEMVRLDSVLSDEIDLLKLDLQGYELEALRGCGDLLARTKTITTEIEFVPLYVDQPLFGEVDVFLRAQGFRLLNLYELFTHPDGQLTSGDAVYLNERYF